MESAVRYDFSFPPKSSNNNLIQSSNCGNNNNNIGGHVVHNANSTHTIHNIRSNQHYDQKFNYTNSHNNIGLPKSASTSLLTSCSSSNINSSKLNNNYCNNCNNCSSAKETINNNNMLQNNLNMKNCLVNKPQHHNVIKPSALGQMGSMHHGAIVNSINQSIGAAPQTPKDANNCSFTFDDLKNTLAFMEDSPLIKQIDNSSHLTNVNSGVNNVLMVNPNTGSGAESGLSSSSSVSSSSSSCNSCCAPSFLPKSNSNPMLLSVATSSSSITSGSSSSAIPSSPTSASGQIKSDCHTCTGSTGNLAHQFQQSSNVLDLFINKNASSDIETNAQYDSYSSSTNTSLITTSSSLNNNSSTNLLTSVSNQQTGGINSAVETAAKKYRCAAQISEATCCWKGKLPPKQYKTPIVYSTKVFVGGLPWDITEEDIVKEFGVFGPCRVEWTNKEKFNIQNGQSQLQMQQNEYEKINNYENQNQNNQYNNYQNNYRNNNRNSLGNLLNGSNVNINNNNNSNNNGNSNNNDPLNSSKHRLSPGFAYVIYESEYSVRSLVGNCIEDYQNGRDRVEYYFKISTRRVRNKEVQIIPWILADNNFALCTPKELDPKKTVFVGNLHGTMTARDLAHIMNELFGCVVYAGIDIDKLKYPIGSGRVTFSHQQNFMRAVRAAFVDIQSSKFSKRIQIDPYLEDVQCCLCYGDKGIYFCRDFQCFNYYCGCCWEKQHSYNQLGNHKPLMRKREDKLN